jgi:transcription initiation factor TFIIB
MTNLTTQAENRTKSGSESRNPSRTVRPESPPPETSPQEETCPECNASLVSSDGHEKVCSDCGLVVEDQAIDHGKEWREFSDQDREKRRRTGSGLTELRHDRGFSTKMQGKRDAKGNTISASKQRKLRRLQKLNSQAKAPTQSDRTLRQGITEICRMASALGLPDHIQKVSVRLYRQVLDEGVHLGHSIEAFATACLYASARVNDVPRTLDEFKPVSRVPLSKVRTAYRNLIRGLPIEVPPPSAEQYLSRFISRLGLSEGDSQLLEKRTRDILEEYDRTEACSDRAPASIAAGAIYLAGQQLGDVSPSQADVADAADVTPNTIRNIFHPLRDSLDG